MIHDGYPVKTFKTASAFETWLGKNHSKVNGLWMKIAKANTGIASVVFADALDIALCYGWIDGMRRGLDEQYYVQKFTPRRSRSVWSVINKNKVTQLIKEGRMKPAGLAAIEEAKTNGQWDKAYHSPANIQVPEYLQKALDKHKKAKAFFATLTSQNRFAILYRLQQVKREETKMKKLEAFIKMLEEGKTIYSQK
jgi:uncharacterized protein YdeI (YjbR/CyaY-like superfamily)